MKNKTSIKRKILLLATISVLITIVFFTNLFENTLLLVIANTNYIPNDSNIFFFEPTVIDDGSGEYWRYGEDLSNYYFFSLDEEKVYFFIEKNNNCTNFNPKNFETWCIKNRRSQNQ